MGQRAQNIERVIIRGEYQDGNILQWVKMLAIKPDSKSLIHRTCIVERKN